MELFAIASACHRVALPWRAWKFVTDRADDSAAENWQAQVGSGEAMFLQALRMLL
jgi:adenosylhomocysteine nucleosidase